MIEKIDKDMLWKMRRSGEVMNDKMNLSDNKDFSYYRLEG